MSDEFAKKVEQESQEQAPQQAQQAQRSATLVITLHPDGNVEITGPIGNDGLCYMMLEKSRAHIQNLHMMKWLKAQESKANGSGINGLLKKMGRG